MIDSVSGTERLGVSYKTSVNAGMDDFRLQGASGKPAAAPAGDELVLSEAAQQAFAARNTDFDASRVDAIKEAIRSGNFPLDARRIAENFVALERLIGGIGA